jgi:hypothetical protein
VGLVDGALEGKEKYLSLRLILEMILMKYIERSIVRAQ